MLYMVSGMNSQSKYKLRLLGGILGYVLGLLALNWLYEPGRPDKYWLAILPVLPLVYMATVIVRYVSELDEMWRKVLAEAMAFSGIATGFTCFSYLFVRDMGGPEFRAEWAFYLMWAYYGIGMIASVRRYQ
jgi:hypothetical protein